VQVNGANASVRLQCVTWDSLELVSVDQQSEDVSSVSERMFVRTYNNGCRPRYECIQFRLTAPSVLLYRRSRYRLWPFNGTTGITVDCRSLFTYDQVWYQLLVSTSGLHARCRLPASVVGEELSVELKSGLRCRGFIRVSEEGNSSAGYFKLLLRDCPAGHESEQIYQCLDSTCQYDDNGRETDTSVLVSADSAGGDLLCWWLGRSDSTRFLLLSAPACYDAQMAATLQPLAVFTRRTHGATTSVVVVSSTPTSNSTRELSQSDAEQAANVANGINNNAALLRQFSVTFVSVVSRYVASSTC